jgi:hypothetical protein
MASGGQSRLFAWSPSPMTRHADEVLGGELGAEQRAALQADLRGELLHQAGLADTGLSPDENRPDHRDVQEEFRQLCGRDRDRSVPTQARVRSARAGRHLIIQRARPGPFFPGGPREWARRE